MRRFRIGMLGIPLAILAGSACDGGTQARLIATYRAADFASSNSHLTPSTVKLSTTFDLGHAYQVTSRRLEYASVSTDSDPPIDDHGQLVHPKYVNAEDPTLVDENGDPVPGRREGGTLEAELPTRAVGSSQIYYRWVIEYTSGGDRLTMRKSDIFRIGAGREAPEAEDARVSF